MGLSDRVFLTGYRANVADYVNALDVVIHASILPEPFGRVVLEGMALRKPVIGTRAGGVPDIIEDGTTGLLYTPGDDAALADCIARLVEDAKLRGSMGEAGYDRLVERFSVRRNVESTQQLYVSVMRENVDRLSDSRSAKACASTGSHGVIEATGSAVRGGKRGAGGPE
jgi:hypothetical protein